MLVMVNLRLLVTISGILAAGLSVVDAFNSNGCGLWPLPGVPSRISFTSHRKGRHENASHALARADGAPSPRTVLDAAERLKDNRAIDAYFYDYPRICYHADSAWHAMLTGVSRFLLSC